MLSLSIKILVEHLPLKTFFCGSKECVEPLHSVLIGPFFQRLVKALTFGSWERDNAPVNQIADKE